MGSKGFLGKLLVAFALVVSAAIPAFAVDLEVVRRELAGEGVVGHIHGSVDDRNLFVFTYRNPEDYFDMVQMSLIGESDAVRDGLAALSRHDKIRVRGELLRNPSPQPHILVTAFDLIEKWESSQPVPPYEHGSIPDDLKTARSGIFLVHAIAGEGAILVLEYGDQIVPVFVERPELTKDLYRNDMVELKIKARSYPNRPMHLALDHEQEEPVRVLQKVSEMHLKPATVEGALILFPQSPGIMFNVFAVQEPLEHSLSRQYTLINFDDQDAFRRIREKLQAEWDKYPGQYVNARNKLVSTKIRLRVTGRYNVIDPSQANVQILLDDESKIEFLQ